MLCTLLCKRRAFLINKNYPALLKIFIFGAITYSASSGLYFIATITAVIIGLTLLHGRGDNVIHVNGILLSVIAAIAYACYVYFSQHTTKNIDSSLLTLLVCVGNTIIFLILSSYHHSFLIPHSPSAWFYICTLGIIATALPIQLLLVYNTLQSLYSVSARTGGDGTRGVPITKRIAKRATNSGCDRHFKWSNSDPT